MMLRGDLSAQWTTSPLIDHGSGPEKDNIWTIRGVPQYSGTEYPVDTSDSFLAP